MGLTDRPIGYRNETERGTMAPTQQQTKRYPSTHELDVEARRNAAEASDKPTDEVYAPYAVEDNDVSGYVGVDPMYMTYANDTEKPLAADGGVFAEIENESLNPEPTVAEEQALEGDDIVDPETESESNVAQTQAKLVVAEGSETVVPPSPKAPATRTVVSKEASEKEAGKADAKPDDDK